jgi:hypothetical protein
MRQETIVVLVMMFVSIIIMAKVFDAESETVRSIAKAILFFGLLFAVLWETHPRRNPRGRSS